MRSTTEVPGRYSGCTLDAEDVLDEDDQSVVLRAYKSTTPAQVKALAAAKRFGAGEIRGLVLSGPPGVGKSHLASGAFGDWEVREGAVFRAALKREQEERADEISRLAPWEHLRSRVKSKMDARWLNVPLAITDLRGEMGRRFTDEDHEPMVDELAYLRKSTGALILDDLGREKVSDWTGEAIYVLVNARYEAMLPTLVTTNLSPDELRASGYWPAISRLAEGGALVTIDGPDHRLGR